MKYGQKAGRQFPKEDFKMANKHIKMDSTSLITRGIQIKI